MIPELAHFAAILALWIALLQALLPLRAGAARSGAAGADGGMAAGPSRAAEARAAVLLQQARRCAVAACALLALSLAGLAWSFVALDFSVRYVANHSHSTLPLAYRVAAVWGSHEGSMLLWLLVLALWGAAVARFSRSLPTLFALRLLGGLGLLVAAFGLYVLLASSPFTRLLPPPADGADLNALLQDPAMVVHPPALYLGYVGFAVPFAFALAVLWERELQPQWARWLRPWVLVSWALLSLGIGLGSAWAYYVLGWGGWWFWDPVENAALLPWLVGTALLHVLAVAQRRGGQTAAVLLLCIGGFALALVGTFIVRSGVVTSVHAFASDPRRGLFILALVAALIGGALALWALRPPRAAAATAHALLSRETLLLSNLLLMAVAAASVLLATLYPMALEALGGARISVGAPYFEAVMLPLLAPAVFLMGAAPFAAWGRAAARPLAHRLRWAAAASAVAAGAAMALLGHWSPLFGLGLWLAGWIFATTLQQVLHQPRAGRAAWGMRLAHLGVGVFVLGVCAVKGLEVERELPLAVGDGAALGPYRVQLLAVQPLQGVNHDGVQARVEVWRGTELVAQLSPQRRAFRAQDQTLAVPAIDRSPWRDLYVALGDPLGAGRWAVRLQLKPMVNWIWAGVLLMALGGALAALDAQYRRRAVAAQAGAGAPQRRAA
ncbi:heme lyase CcmF/NrfE family subunit [Azohydromonas lata]|uniref:Heme lyase CcmF/NrfE family subunit n=1 Tax=Azohydromonas lata TaxID=45677 RepID=A0ABU5IPX9_9BURK|nr:heme lyase CcmF/NrfE family subunit [Azohydromonas lata]MDZ5460955.1 heme lyase CcmF/NrfE family subunit [Azohydromonas lata]